MKNYYQILGIPESADQVLIKSTFKKLALDSHPDRHPDDPLAESRFKEINEAYQTLSDLEKKVLYDSRLSYDKYTRKYSSVFNPTPPPPPRTRSAPRYSPYRYGKEFKRRELRNTLAAFVIMGILGTVTFAITGGYNYYQHRIEQQALLKYRGITNRAQTHYNQGNFGSAIAIIDSVPTKYIYELNFNFFRDRVLHDLDQRASRHFGQGEFQLASLDYRFLRMYARIFTEKSKRNLALCYKELGDLRAASEMLEELIAFNPHSIELYLDIANINRDHLQDLDKAVEYYEKGSEAAIKYYEGVYGKAFYILVQPKRTPQIHYDLYFNKAIAYYQKENYLQARYAINWATFLRPSKGEAMVAKGKVYSAMGKGNEACDFWQVAIDLGEEEAISLQKENCGV